MYAPVQIDLPETRLNYELRGSGPAIALVGSPMTAEELPASVRWVPDVEALRRGPRIVLGIGEESAGQLCERTTEALAARLGLTAMRFPGDHTGFVDHSQAFAARLKDALTPLRRAPASR